MTEQGLLIPKHLLQGIDQVEIRWEHNLLLLLPITANDPIFDLGKQPIEDDITDASTNLDGYLYDP